ncbi:hypothetical protein HK104_011378 [Borealophlyctis nickersoniae]|nr:hypothetical protein HK104_011378 [Borealophlyctis nickersoniae]
MTKDVQDSVMQQDSSLPSYVVVQNYKPKKRDELHLTVGEIVTVSMTFTDGWCHGYNCSTLKLGTFPLSAVAVLQADSRRSTLTTAEADLQGPTSPSGDPHPIQFTMVAPEQALEVVTKGLSAERRAQYFESLLRDASLDENTREQFKSVAEGANNSPLKEDVREALLGHLEKGFKRWMARVDGGGRPGLGLRRAKTSAGPRLPRPIPVRTQTL